MFVLRDICSLFSCLYVWVGVQIVNSCLFVKNTHLFEFPFREEVKSIWHKLKN